MSPSEGDAREADDDAAPSTSRRELEWCACTLMHGIPGFCFCGFGPTQQQAFLRSKARLTPATTSGEALQPKALAPKTPSNPEAALAHAAKALCASLSGAQSHWSDSASGVNAHSAPPPSPTRDLPARRLEGDFDKASSGGCPPASSAGASDGKVDAKRVSLLRYLRRKAKKRRKQRRRKYKMPWHAWMCAGCGKRLPDTHRGCIEPELRAFDLDVRYGPCDGITRRARWERAYDLGLSPPVRIVEILLSHVAHHPPANDALWNKAR